MTDSLNGPTGRCVYVLSTGMLHLHDRISDVALWPARQSFKIQTSYATYNQNEFAHDAAAAPCDTAIKLVPG